MKQRLKPILLFGSLALSLVAFSQSTDNPAMNDPDQVAWRLFIQVNTAAGGSNALFETWASDTDTFKRLHSFPPRRAH
jgi:hypothetical protein